MTDSTVTQPYTVAADEKVTPVMVYLQTGLAKGELLSKQPVRVSTWLRSTSGINYVTLYKAQALTITGGSAPQAISVPELHIPIAQIIAYHLLPPAQEPLDYDSSEPNRKFVDVTLLIASFRAHVKMRISTNTNLATHLRTAREAYLSLYDAEISNPGLTSMGVIRAPMILVQPQMAVFALRA